MFLEHRKHWRKEQISILKWEKSAETPIEAQTVAPIEVGKKEVITTPIEEKLELNTNVKNVDIKDVNTDIKRFKRRGERDIW